MRVLLFWKAGRQMAIFPLGGRILWALGSHTL